MFFLMSLALRMGKTLKQLGEEMTASELKLWLAYDRKSPLSDVRGDIQTASIVSAVINAQGGKISLEDALLRWGQEASEEEVSPIESFFEGLLR